MVGYEMPPVLELPKDAEVMVLGKTSPALPARLISFSDTEFAIESPLDAPVYAPIRVSWDTYVVLGEVLEVQGDGDARVIRALLQHYVDLTVAAESSAYWS